MMRKSRDQRIADIKTTISKYESAGLEQDRSVRFLKDMCYRLERGKSLTTKQRAWADKLCSSELPKLKNEARVKEILAAAEVDGMQQLSSTLKDFAFKIGKGWNLSEKQQSFLASMLQKAEKLRVTGRFRPDENCVSDLRAAVSICSRKNSWYWQHRPGTAKAFGKVEAWLAWDDRRKTIDEVRAAGVDAVPLHEEPIIDQWACDKLLGAVKKQLEELKSPKYLAGSMAWRVMYRAPNALGLVTGAPFVKNGDIVYPFLVDGEDVNVPASELRKRRG
jgi:hypothetical protein